ncbi:MATE family efflux transporter [Halocatena pleomorpha]|uniref:Multidrug-efflux transporter n=1 Tax=Halocatena pleomorpha TaxID=1785090 RepID=A0A3P3R4S8_9EURY|nr:MATE family efflux transporter [Halocatena pleomorpha]RRJ28344.1 MATE family efflux transporter [Halocatena pleomorpha]
MFNINNEDITQGSLARGLLVLSGPLLVQNIVQVIQQVVDLFWVGRLSSDAVAAIGFTMPLISVVSSVVLVMPFVGTQVLVSQRVGSEHWSGARRGLFTGLVVSVGTGLVLGVVAFVGARPFFELLMSVRPGSVSSQVVDLAVAYFGVFAAGVWIAGVSDTTEAAFIGWGDSRAALYMNVIALSVNMILDPILIFGFYDNPLFVGLGLTGLQSAAASMTQFSGVGIAGAALSTLVGYGVGGATGLALIARGRNDGMLSRAAVGIDMGTVRELVDIGVPAGGQSILKQGVELALILVVFRAAGSAGLAAYIVGYRVASIAVIPSRSLQQAAQSIIGQNLGAGATDRARRTTWIGVGIAGGTLAFIGLAQLAIPETIATLFVPSLSSTATHLAVEYLAILAYGYPAIGAVYLFQAGFNGARRTQTSFAASLLQYWGVRLPIAVVGGIVLSLQASGVFWAVTISNIVAALGLAGYYRYATAEGMLDRAAYAAAAD